MADGHHAIHAQSRASFGVTCLRLPAKMPMDREEHPRFRMTENVPHLIEPSGRPGDINNDPHHFDENTARYAGEISRYLENRLSQTLPEAFRASYEELLRRHYERLREKPIHPQCKLTLVLPAYREEQVIAQTLQSLEQQKGVSAEDFEVIVVNNYPEGQKPRINDYDEAGRKIGEHEDRTTEAVQEFAAHSSLRVLVVEQVFPKGIAGVGVASKLGMDLALKRQQNNPRIIGYYGADNAFGESWIRGVLDGFSHPDVDGVRGIAKWSTPDNRIEDEFGLHVLTPAELATISELQRQRSEYNMRLRRLENLQREGSGRNHKQLDGLPTLTAGMYAKIGGMNPQLCGEDWGLAQDVADQGRIYWNQNMRTMALARIEKPRVQGGSYTEGLWTMFRAYHYGEGDFLDKDKNLLVEDPERTLTMNRLEALMKKACAGQGDAETDAQLLEFFEPDELAQIKTLLSQFLAWQTNHAISLRDRARGQNQGNWAKFTRHLPEELTAKISARWEARFPKIKLAEAEAKLPTQ
jgi:hypothetical protein